MWDSDFDYASDKEDVEEQKHHAPNVVRKKVQNSHGKTLIKEVPKALVRVVVLVAHQRLHL